QELGAGVDHDRIERRDDAALRHIGGLGGREYLLVSDIAHELGGERNGARAVIDDGDFELADLAAIEARRLTAGERRGGLRGRGEWRECAGGGRDGGGNDAATGQFGHGVLRKAAPRAHGHGGGGHRRCYSFSAQDRRSSQDRSWPHRAAMPSRAPALSDRPRLYPSASSALP